jgi:hypothetical protein
VPIDSDGFMKVVEAPTGFMRIRRAVLETTIARMPELLYRPDALHGYCHRFFDVMVDRETGRYLFDVYAFCRRWRALGGKVFVDARSKLAHHGSYTYRGDFGSAWAQDPARAIGGQRAHDARSLRTGASTRRPNAPLKWITFFPSTKAWASGTGMC